MSIHVQPPRTYGNFVGGKQVDAANGATFPSTNPTSGSHWGNFALSSAADVDLAVKKRACGLYRRMGKALAHRARQAADRHGARRSRARPSGSAPSNRPRTASCSPRCACRPRSRKTGCGISADWPTRSRARLFRSPARACLNYTLREPIGVIGVITAWNSPTFLNIMAAAPALAAGNTIVHQALGGHPGIRHRDRAARDRSGHSGRRRQCRDRACAKPAKRWSIIRWCARFRSSAASA